MTRPLEAYEYCGIPCEGCPVIGVTQGNVGVEIVIQAHIREMDGHTPQQEIELRAREEGVSSPELVAAAIYRHLRPPGDQNGCSTSPEHMQS